MIRMRLAESSQGLRVSCLRGFKAGMGLVDGRGPQPDTAITGSTHGLVAKLDGSDSWNGVQVRESDVARASVDRVLTVKDCNFSLSRKTTAFEL